MGFYYGNQIFGVKVTQGYAYNDPVFIYTISKRMTEDEQNTALANAYSEYLKLKDDPYVYHVRVEMTCTLDYPATTSKTWLASTKDVVERYLSTGNRCADVPF
jgi:hypothetical protein